MYLVQDSALVILTLFNSALFLIIAKKHRKVAFFLLFFVMFSFSVLVLLDFISYYTGNHLLDQINQTFILSIVFITLMIFLDYIFKEGIDPIRLILETIIVVGYNLFLWGGIFIDGVTINDFISGNQTILYMASSFFQTVVFIILFFWMTITWQSAPSSLKRPGFGLFIVGLLFISTQVLFITGIAYLGTIALITEFFSVLLSSIILYKYPQLMHVIPFKIYALIVVKRGGMPCFIYEWKNTKDDEKGEDSMKLATMIHAIETMGEETLKRGDILNLHVVNGTLMLNTHNPKYIIGLLTSKQSKLLRDIIDEFAKEFYVKYKDIKGPVDPSKFKDGIELVKKNFLWL